MARSTALVKARFVAFSRADAAGPGKSNPANAPLRGHDMKTAPAVEAAGAMGIRDQAAAPSALNR